MTPTGAIMLKLIRDTAVTVLEICLGVFLALVVVGRGVEPYTLADWRLLGVSAFVAIVLIGFLKWWPIKPDRPA
jgi:hypothetical protein